MKKILLAEDELMLASMYKTKFEKEGYEVTLAFNGKEALEKFDNHDLVTLDIIMPKLDGFAVLKELRKITNVPILILTNIPDEKEKGLRLGATDYLYKGDYTPSGVLEKIKQNVI